MYCLLMWYICFVVLSRKRENIGRCFEVIVLWQILQLRQLTSKSGAAFHECEPLQKLTIDVIRTLNSLNPDLRNTRKVHTQPGQKKISC